MTPYILKWGPRELNKEGGGRGGGGGGWVGWMCPRFGKNYKDMNNFNLFFSVISLNTECLIVN